MSRFEIIFICMIVGALIGGIVGAAFGIVAIKLAVDTAARAQRSMAGEVALAIPFYALSGVPSGLVVGFVFGVIRARRKAA